MIRQFPPKVSKKLCFLVNERNTVSFVAANFVKTGKVGDGLYRLT